MQPEIGFTNQTAMEEIAREVIETVADRLGDSPARRTARQQAAAWSISSLQPRDPVETMLAGHCVIFDHLLRDGTYDMLRCQQQDIKLRARPQLLATGKMFLAHLEKFEQLHTRLGEQLLFRPPVEKTAAPEASSGALRDDATLPPANTTQHPDPEAPPLPEAATMPGVQNAPDVEAKIGTPRMTGVQGAVAPVEPPAMVHQSQTRQVTTPAAQPVVRQPAVAQATCHSAAPAANGGVGTGQAASGRLPEQPRPGLQKPSPAETDRIQSGAQRNQISSGDRQSDTLAMLTASPSVSPSSGIAGQTSPAGQPRAAVQSVKVEAAV